MFAIRQNNYSDLKQWKIGNFWNYIVIFITDSPIKISKSISAYWSISINKMWKYQSKIYIQFSKIIAWYINSWKIEREDVSQIPTL